MLHSKRILISILSMQHGCWRLIEAKHRRHLPLGNVDKDQTLQQRRRQRQRRSREEILEDFYEEDLLSLKDDEIHEMANIANDMRSMDINWEKLQEHYRNAMITASMDEDKNGDNMMIMPTLTSYPTDVGDNNNGFLQMNQQQETTTTTTTTSQRYLKGKTIKKAYAKTSKTATSAKTSKTGKVVSPGSKTAKSIDPGSKTAKMGKSSKGIISNGDNPVTLSPTQAPTQTPPPPTPGPTFSNAPSIYTPYKYSRGTCPNAGSLGVPCGEDLDLYEKCNKYNPRSSFRACYESCKPSFCCIHDASRTLNNFAPNCNTDENCPQYAYCYIVWWKLHDTVGPAPYIHPGQDDQFFDMESEDFQRETTDDIDFYEELLMHHWDDVQTIRDAGRNAQGEFENAKVFDVNTYWELNI